MLHIPEGQATPHFLSSVRTGRRPVVHVVGLTGSLRMGTLGTGGAIAKKTSQKNVKKKICLRTSARPSVCVCVCRCVAGGSVSGLCRSRPVINVPGRVGPKRYITNRRGGRVHGGGWGGGGEDGARERGAAAGGKGMRRRGERRWGRGRGGGSIGEEKEGKRGERERGRQGLFSPGSCYVSHYVSPGHRQHASRQNKRVSLAWHCSYFPILTTGSGRGQAAGWGAGGIVGSGPASKTQKAQGSSTS